jgi:tetratricopeptide (TPR) repeat protein
MTNERLGSGRPLLAALAASAVLACALSAAAGAPGGARPEIEEFEVAAEPVDIDQKTAGVWKELAAFCAKDCYKGKLRLSSAGAGRGMLRALLAGNPRPDVLEAIGDMAARGGPVATGGAVTMGADSPSGGGDLREVALDAYVKILADHPRFDRRGFVSSKALALVVATEDEGERMASLRKAAEGERPGLVAALVFRADAAGGRGAEAAALLGRMMNDPQKYLPKSDSSFECLRLGCGLFVERGDFAKAWKTAELHESLHRRRGDEGAALWLSLAKAYEKAERPAEAAKAYRKVVWDYYMTHLSAAARRKLEGLPPMADRELAKASEKARIAPRLYQVLAAEYARAGRYDEAREAYAFYAKRYNDPSSYLAAAQTYLDEGKVEEGLRQFNAVLAQHPRAAGEKLLVRLRRAHTARGETVECGEFYLSLAAKLEKGKATPYLRQAVMALRRARLEGVSDAKLALLKSAAEKSPHRDDFRKIAFGIYMQTARNLAAKNQPQEARKWFLLAVQVAPGEEEATEAKEAAAALEKGAAKEG